MTESEESPFGATGAHTESEGVERLQTAAHEMIAAARAMLDIAEEVVADPRAIGTVFSAIADATTDLIRSASHHGPLHGAGRDDAAADGDNPDDFQHIHID